MITFLEGCYFYVPDRNFRKPHIAPYWTDLFPLGGGNGGCFNHQVYTDSASLTMASDTVKNFTNFPNFQAKWVLVSTWLRVPFYYSNAPVSMPFASNIQSTINYSKPYIFPFMSHILKAILWFQVVSVQCLLITDHVSTYTLFNYMDVNINPRYHKIRISFDNGSPTENPYSFTNQAYSMSTYNGNTGEIIQTCILLDLIYQIIYCQAKLYIQYISRTF
jgi:hypothetical protein